MYNEQIEQLINAALADGILTEKEKQVLFKRAEEQGIDLDEFEMVLAAKLFELEKTKAEIEADAQRQSAPKSGKYGDVRKCPACGAIVGAFQGFCPDCGYEFSNIDANSYSKKFYATLLKEEDEDKKIEIIENYPIPLTKADLLDFLTAMKPKVLASDYFSEAYFKKYGECIEKARVAFPDDKRLLSFVKDYDNPKSKISKVGESYKFSYKVVLFAFMPWILVLLCLTPIPINRLISNHKIEKCQTYIEKGRLDDAKSLLTSIKFRKKTIGQFYNLSRQLVESYVTEGEVEKAVDVERLNPKKSKSVYVQSDDYCISIIKEAYIKSGDYDKAWKYKKSSRNFDDPYYADEYYKFMSDIVYSLCKNGDKDEAKRFVNEYSVWFQKNVDTDSHYKKGEYTYSKSKARLMKIISDY